MRFLLLHAWIGWGHKTAALSLQEQLNLRQIDNEVIDILDHLPRPLARFYPWSYAFLTGRLPRVWDFFYRWNDRPQRPYAPAQSAWQSPQFRRLLDRVSSGNYTHLVSTHFTAAALLVDWRKRFGLRQPIYSVITDYVGHRCWRRLGMDHYFTPCEAVAAELRDIGVPPGDITVSGIPVSARFNSPVSRETARRNWQVEAGQTGILVMTSGLSDQAAVALISDLRALAHAARFLVSAAKEGPRVEKLRHAASGDGRFNIFGFSSDIPEMMKACDLVISKPGGLIVSESLAAGLPMLLFSPIPGQEEGNARFVVGGGAGVVVKARPGIFRETLEPILSQPGRLAQMTGSAGKLGRPDSSRVVIDTILAEH